MRKLADFTRFATNLSAVTEQGARDAGHFRGFRTGVNDSYDKLDSALTSPDLIESRIPLTFLPRNQP